MMLNDSTEVEKFNAFEPQSDRARMHCFRNIFGMNGLLRPPQVPGMESGLHRMSL